LFTDFHERLVEQDLVEILAHVEDRVGDNALEIQTRNLAG
jgi:hypothetical protein